MTKEQIIHDYLSAIGRKGGAAGKGERKARQMGREHYDKLIVTGKQIGRAHV